MSQDTQKLEVNQTEMLSLEQVAQVGARQMLALAVQAEIQSYLASFADLQTPDGHQAVVRNGYHHPRTITSCHGPVEVAVPRSRSRVEGVAAFASALIPKYMRKTLALEEALPLFYLGGLSNGDFIPCFEKLFGTVPAGLSPTSITRLKRVWLTEMAQWRQRDLTDAQYCYLWVDGIHFNLRLAEGRLCVLVVIGARATGRKELVAVVGGYRESAESWRTLLRDLQHRGMPCPTLCIGDGALGFWKAVTDIYPETAHQRCWVHKTANILDKMPKAAQPQAKTLIHDMYRAETETQARASYQAFIARYQATYPKAVACLTKDEDTLFTFYRFPAEHWQHIRSTNVIESTFATVRLRTHKTRGQGTLNMTLAMVFKLAERAALRWRKLRGYKLLTMVGKGVVFTDGKIDKLAA
jgi:transposase-like protein